MERYPDMTKFEYIADYEEESSSFTERFNTCTASSIDNMIHSVSLCHHLSTIIKSQYFGDWLDKRCTNYLNRQRKMDEVIL